MADEAQTLKRDSTMVATATEGNAILEKLGKVDEDAKTRSQQKKIEDEAENESEATPKMERTTTMAATAKEGADLLDGAELGKTRGETAKLEEEAKEDEGEDEDEKPSLQRASTMQVTAKEGAELLAASGGVVDGTRSETKKVEEAMKANEEENQSANGTSNDENDGEGALKRKGTMQLTAEEGEEFLKRQKLADSDEKEAVKEVEA